MWKKVIIKLSILNICVVKFEAENFGHLHSYISVSVDGWMDGWVERSKSQFKDCLQQSKMQMR